MSAIVECLHFNAVIIQSYVRFNGLQDMFQSTFNQFYKALVYECIISFIQAHDLDSGSFGDITYHLEGDKDRYISFSINMYEFNSTLYKYQNDRNMIVVLVSREAERLACI